ncbi:hypothetical protein [Nocardia salmonicida]|uniref:hypothetical protein n=1 Tax=Nocardia salmonicida TaxID=53431 RepID=UPI0007A416CA|nr:hypothetical protein [Nocardia salmonicida]MBC7299533.1 hypothetical protein [Nocardia sp.]
MSTNSTWTRARLVAALADCYGRTPRGAVDTKAVAADFGVTPRTVRKWMHGADAALAAIPADRLRTLTTGGARTEREADGKAAYAREALAAIALPKERGIKQQWRDQGWLDTHFVLLVHLHGRPWHQLILTKQGNAADQARRRGEVLDQTAVPNKFAGDVLIHAAMQRQAPWAIRPSKAQLAVGRGQVWTADAPELNLSALAVDLDVR